MQNVRRSDKDGHLLLLINIHSLYVNSYSWSFDSPFRENHLLLLNQRSRALFNSPFLFSLKNCPWCKHIWPHTEFSSILLLVLMIFLVMWGRGVGSDFVSLLPLLYILEESSNDSKVDFKNAFK